MMRSCQIVKLLCVSFAFLYVQIYGQSSPKREVRAAWIATVSNVDYPSTSGLSTAAQQNEFRVLLDSFASAGINTIYVQVRPSCDAFCAASGEPWSQWLCGTQGSAPNPYYDPLAFYITEAHQRGMEIHAWINPYRSVVSILSSSIAYNHISVLQPSWNVTYNNTKILNPGLNAVRQYVKNVILNIVNNYDIDGIHFDDYFYPYPQSGYTFNDAAAFAADPRGFTNIDDWRRDNVNIFISLVYDSIKAAKRHVKFGVSPFGIWKSGTPTGITGLSSYYEIYCDPVTWLNQKKTDYVIPQLYWAIGGSQDFNALAAWWGQQAAANGRHCYAGIATYRMGSSNWPASEILNQINSTRNLPAVQGYSFFSASQLLSNTKKINDSLRVSRHKYKCLIPEMPWLDSIKPNPPLNLTVSAASDHVLLTWQVPQAAADGDSARYFVIYRFPDYMSIDLQNTAAIVGITPNDTTAFTDSVALTPGSAAVYVLTAADRLHNESIPVSVQVCYNCITATNDDCAQATLLTSRNNCIYTAGTMTGAYSSPFPQPGCDFFANPALKDVFYSFTATDTTHTIEVNPLGNGIEAVDAVITIYRNGCTFPVEVACTGADGGSGGTTKTLTLNDFVPGENYLIRIYDYGTYDPLYPDFEICITHPVQSATEAESDSNTEFILFPNPAESYFILDGPEAVLRLHIVSVKGQTVYRDCILDTQTLVLLPELEPGFYIVILETSSGYVYRKLIIQ